MGGAESRDRSSAVVSGLSWKPGGGLQSVGTQTALVGAPSLLASHFVHNSSTMSSSQRSRRDVRRTSYAAESSGEEEDAASDFSLSDSSVASDPSATQKTPSATQKTPSVARKTPSVIKKKKTSTPSTSKKQSDTKKPAVAKKSAAAKKKDPVVVTSKAPSMDTNKKSPDATPKETTKDAKPVQKKKAAKKKASTQAESYDIQTSDTNEYTLLIQVDPNQSLDLTGAVGAVGRFETDEEGGECGIQNVVVGCIVSLGLQSFLISRVASTTVVSIPALRRCFSPTYIPKSVKATMALQCFVWKV